MAVAQPVEVDNAERERGRPDGDVFDREAASADDDAEAYVGALRVIGPCGYGAVARHLAWGATRAGRAETALRLAGRIAYDRTGRGALVETKAET